MLVLVFNAGSSSLKFGIFDVNDQTREVFKGTFERFRNGLCEYYFQHRGAEERGELPYSSLREALGAVPAVLIRFGLSFEAIGHRVVHGGKDFSSPTIFDDETIDSITSLIPLAPSHLPANVEAVKLCRTLWPSVPQVAVFDTAFHLTNPPFATTYAVPLKWREAGLRRYGFHGTSHKYVAHRVAAELNLPLSKLQLISIHLGNGASVCAINRGQSMDSSMGMTPLEGLVMGTRSGDVDPGAFGFLSRELNLSVQQIEDALYADSGLKGLTGSSDMREIETLAASGDINSQLAIEVYAYRAKKYIGAYAAGMGGLDAIVFTGGIGENSPSMRRRICDGLEFMGLQLDHDRNLSVELSAGKAPQIQAYGAGARIFVTETAEQLMIARETAAVCSQTKLITPLRLPVAVSGRHVHLSTEDVETLFGQGYVLQKAAPLRQPGHWIAKERISLVGPNGRLDQVAILGPIRERTQIEVSRTDTFALGIDVPVRDSGNLEGTPQVKLVGPQGSITSSGLIIAARHLHTNPEDAARLGLKDGQHIDVFVGDAGRQLTLSHTLVRVRPQAFTEIHIDTDEANAAGIKSKVDGTLVGRTQA